MDEHHELIWRVHRMKSENRKIYSKQYIFNTGIPVFTDALKMQKITE